jgi:hypothetical protein
MLWWTYECKKSFFRVMTHPLKNNNVLVGFFALAIAVFSVLLIISKGTGDMDMLVLFSEVNGQVVRNGVPVERVEII